MLCYIFMLECKPGHIQQELSSFMLRKKKVSWSYIFFHPKSEAHNKKSVPVKSWSEGRLGSREGVKRNTLSHTHVFPKHKYNSAARENGLGFPSWIREPDEMLTILSVSMCIIPTFPWSFLLTNSHLSHMPHSSRLAVGLVPVPISWNKWQE